MGADSTRARHTHVRRMDLSVFDGVSLIAQIVAVYRRAVSRDLTSPGVRVFKPSGCIARLSCPHPFLPDMGGHLQVQVTQV